METPAYILISVPKDDALPDSAAITRAVGGTAETWPFEVPADLQVGTLDALMSLSEDLMRTDSQVESAVKKVARQFAELNEGKEDQLTVDGQVAERYLQNFRWNSARYPVARSLGDLSSQLSSVVAKTDDELRQLSAAYTEKRGALSALQRKKGGNLMVTSLEDLIVDEIAEKAEWLDSDYFHTVVVVLPRTSEADFLSRYELLAGDAVPYGTEEDRDAVRGSPVVPESAVKLVEDREGFVAFAVALLRKFEDDFIHAAREHGYVVRPFALRAPAGGGGGGSGGAGAGGEEEAGGGSVTLAEQIGRLEVETNKMRSAMLRWCKAHFEVAYSAWLHLKALRVFVESVLRYSLPVNFQCMLLRPRVKRAKLRAALAVACKHLDGGSGLLEADDAHAALVGGGEFFSYVSLYVRPVVD